MRRILAGAAAAGLGLVLALAPASQAQDSIPPAYAGSKLTTPASIPSSSPAITANIVRSFNGNLQQLIVKTYLTTPSNLPSGCGTPGEALLSPQTVGPSGAPNTAATSAPAYTPCNGNYGIRVEATLKNKLSGGTVDQATLRGQVSIVAEPSAVSDVNATFDGGAVTITWAGYSSPPKDFTGYRVQRQDGDEWTTLGDVDTDRRSFTDGSPPAEGGRITYRVLAKRNGPGDDITCGCGGKTVVEIPSSTTTSSTVPGQTDGGGGGGDGGGGDGGAGGGGDGGGADGGTTSTTVITGGGKKPPTGGRTFSALPRGQVGVGTKAPRLGTPTGANIPDLLTDDGFDEELDYGDLGGGDESEDGLSSFYYEGAGGRGMAVPVATGFVLFAWAVHLRYLARAAKPARAAPARRRRKPPTRGSGPAHGGRGPARGPARGRRTAPTKRGWAFR